MPKTFTQQQKQRWLELFESGKSDKWIANNSKIDYRTVRKGIEEMRRGRNAAAAQVELIKEALSDHKNQLLLVIDEISATVVMPPDNLDVRIENDGSVSAIPLTRATFRFTDTGVPFLDVHAEAKVAWELIQEHLRGDKIWKSYKGWKDALLGHVQARINMKRVAITILKKPTGLKIRGESLSNDSVGYINPETIQTLFQVAMDLALNIPNKTNLEERGIASSMESLRESDEFAEVIASYKSLQEATYRTKRIIDEIGLLRMLPGSCRVCKRLGIK